MTWWTKHQRRRWTGGTSRGSTVGPPRNGPRGVPEFAERATGRRYRRSRHPDRWRRSPRRRRTGGAYFAQHIGDRANVEISEHFLGPIDPSDRRSPDAESARAAAAGLEVVQCRNKGLQLEFFDVGALAYFLRKVIWTVPDFAVDRYRDRRTDVHDRIRREGVSRSTTSRTLFDLREPDPSHSSR